MPCDAFVVSSEIFVLCSDQMCTLVFTRFILQLCASTCVEENVDTGVNCAAESLASQAVERLANADIANSKNKGKLYI